MAPPQSLDDLNDEIICEIYEQTLKPGFHYLSLETLVNLATTNKHMHHLAKCYRYREIDMLSPPSTIEKMRKTYQFLRTHELILNTLRVFEVVLSPLGTHRYHAHAVNVFSFLKCTTRLERLRIWDRYLDDPVKSGITFTQVVRAMQAASLDTLPTLKILETDIVIGPAIMSKCPSLVDLFLEDPDDDAVFARALKETTKLPSLHKLEMHHSALVDKGTIEGIAASFPQLRKLYLSPGNRAFRGFELIPDLVGALPELQELSLLDIRSCGNEDDKSLARLSSRACAEVFARKLFRIGPSLRKIYFNTSYEPHSWDLANLYPLGVQYDTEGHVEALLWLERDAYQDVRNKESWHEGEEDTSAWPERYADMGAREYLDRYGTA